ncbi:ubiquinol-cytochrome C chaperone-domain-containing protein [Cryomyces antarcticus]
MGSNSVCRTCLRALKQRPSAALQTGCTPLRSALLPTLRPLSTSSRLHAKAEPNKTYSPAPVIPPSSDPPSKNVRFEPEKNPDASKLAGFANQVRQRAGAATETYVAYGVTENLFKECSRQAEYTIPQVLEKGGVAPKTEAGEDLGVGTGWWYEDLGLTPTFNTWAQISFLHMYLLTVRFRYFPPDHAPAWHQHLLDHFSYAAEDRMATYHGMVARGTRNKYLKDLFIQWRGVLAAYDEGLIRGDAVMAAAVWRNVFKGDENVDAEKLALIVAFIRKSLRSLDRMPDEEIAGGRVKFGNPGSEKALVAEDSRLLNEPFKEEPKVEEAGGVQTA